MSDEISVLFDRAKTNVNETRRELLDLAACFEITGNVSMGDKLRFLAASLDETSQVLAKAESKSLDRYVASVNQGTATMLATALAMAEMKKE